MSTRSFVKKALRIHLRTKPRRYQRKGIEFMVRSKGNALNCDDMGLGKTYQSLALGAIHPDWRPIVCLCPSGVKFQWQDQWKEHAGLRSYVCDGEMTTKDQDKVALRKKIEELKEEKSGYELRRKIREAKQNYRRRVRENSKKRKILRKQSIIIINYDILEAWLPSLLELKPKYLIIDECHYIMSMKAKRTKACRQLARECDHVVALSGTPISGKPVEFFPVLNMIRPDKFPSFWTYAFKYCSPKKNRWSGSWDFTGKSNLDALRKALKKVMIRRHKRDVLKELPAKTRTFIAAEIDNRKEYKEAEEEFLSWLLRKKGQLKYERALRALAIVKINELKKLAAEGILTRVVTWIKDWLEETEEKLVVFGIHKDILRFLQRKFPDSILVDGSVSSKRIRKKVDGKTVETSKRDEVIRKFKTSKKTRIMFGQLKAAGVGLDGLQAVCSNALFIELGWTPGGLDQAEDRLLRIGQKNKVSIYYMIGKGTIMEKILTIIQSKDETVGHILDGKKGGVMKLLHLFEREAKRRALT